MLDILLDLETLNKTGKACLLGRAANGLAACTSSTSKLTGKTDLSSKLSLNKDSSNRITEKLSSGTDKENGNDEDVCPLVVTALIRFIFCLFCFVAKTIFLALTVLLLYRILLYLGCQHGCNDGIRNPQADFLRTQSRSCLARIQRSDSNNFSRSLIQFVETCDLCMLLDFFHAFMGFCSSDGGSNRLIIAQN